MKHDFDGALDKLTGYSYDLPDDIYESVLLALRLAKRLMEEPSFEMTAHGIIGITSTEIGGSLFLASVRCFKAMRDQLLKECE